MWIMQSNYAVEGLHYQDEFLLVGPSKPHHKEPQAETCSQKALKITGCLVRYYKKATTRQSRC